MVCFRYDCYPFAKKDCYSASQNEKYFTQCLIDGDGCVDSLMSEIEFKVLYRKRGEKE